MKSLKELRRVLLEVRLLPIMETGDAPPYLNREEALNYALGYNDAILEMREIFKKHGIT